MIPLKDIKELLEISKEMSNWIKGDKFDSLSLNCKDNLGIYTTTIVGQSKFFSWVNKLTQKEKIFDPTIVKDISVVSFKPEQKKIYDAVIRTNDDIRIDFSKIPYSEFLKIDIK